jgi:hypothetical protein
MTPTAWDVRNKLVAILNAAKRSGKLYIDVESTNLDKQLGDNPKTNLGLLICNEVMRKMMRAGDLILNDTPNGEDPTMLIRYVFDTKRENLPSSERISEAQADPSRGLSQSAVGPVPHH